MAGFLQQPRTAKVADKPEKLGVRGLLKLSTKKLGGLDNLKN
jgi:hypothetical protein